MQEHIQGLEDPRRQSHKVLYPLDEVLLLTLCGVISGCESFVDIQAYGRAKLNFLRTLAPFENGTPSHDVLSNLFRRLDPKAFEQIFRDWVVGLSEEITGGVAVDGKTVRGTKDNGSHTLHLISAWADEARLVLGQTASTGKKNEIADIPVLLDLLMIKGAIVTCDAMGCQKAIAETIRDKEADYLLALKGNQGTLHEDVKTFFEDEHSLTECAFHETIDGDKGRMETRAHYVCTDIDWLRQRHPGWKDLTMIGMVNATRETGEDKNYGTRFYIGSRDMTPESFAHAVRSHWGVENRLHWILDVTFRDDDCRVRKDNGPENFSVIKHMALNLLNRSKKKLSIRVMRKKAGWDDGFLHSILSG